MIWGGRVDPVKDLFDPNWAEYEGYVSGGLKRDAASLTVGVLGCEPSCTVETVGKQSDPLTSPWQRDYGPRYAKPVPPSVFWGLAVVLGFVVLAQWWFNR